MRVESLGDGRPKYAVIGLTHGDEPCGKKAIEKFLKSEFEILKPVKFIIANEKAAKEDKRFIECDLNRSYPGNPDSDLYEERLAAKILEEVRGLKVLDFHSTKSTGEVFVAQSFLDEDRMSLVKSIGASKVSYRPQKGIGCLDEYAESVAVECGFQGSDRAEENAYNVLLNFLAAEGVINGEFQKSNPELFRIYETVEKPGFEFKAENFSKVEKDSVYGVNGDKELVAEEEFYPVLMSTNGYENILGYKAKKEPL